MSSSIKNSNNQIMYCPKNVYTFLHKFKHYQSLLQEAYEKLNPIQIEELLLQISEELQTQGVDSLKELQLKDIVLYITDKGEYVQGGHYNPTTKETVLYINRKCLQHILAFKNIPFIKKQIESIWVHEDTHKQQDNHSKGKFFSKNYIGPPKENITKKKIVDYVNQKIEVDAYARQYAVDLKNLYPDETIDQLFKRIFTKNINDECLKNNIEVMFECLTVPNQKRLLRRMYDFFAESYT